ncbi:hypothetical protein BH10CYA1_BH10CYA1_64150 [soil metagenome]
MLSSHKTAGGTDAIPLTYLSAADPRTQGEKIPASDAVPDALTTTCESISPPQKCQAARCRLATNIEPRIRCSLVIGSW